jgi:hypothetical protein
VSFLQRTVTLPDEHAWPVNASHNHGARIWFVIDEAARRAGARAPRAQRAMSLILVETHTCA